jgi:hypothetical protein
LVELPPWRFCSNVDRNDCSAVVELEDEPLEAVPPRSPSSFWNAELSVDKVLEDRVLEDEAAEALVPPMSWLLPRS